MTHLKSRMARVAWSLGSLVALAAALGAGRKWAEGPDSRSAEQARQGSTGVVC
jgi:hypothetical protein